MTAATYHVWPATESHGYVSPVRVPWRRDSARPVRRKLPATALAALLLVAGCASANFRGGVYDDGVVRYRVGERTLGWERVQVGDNDLAFHHARFGTMSINATCKEYDDVPEPALMNHLLFGMRNRVYRTEETVTVDGRGAWHVVVDARLDGVPVVLEVYLVQKDGCVYDLVRISSPTQFEAGRPEFERFVRGFKVLSTKLD